MGQQGHDDDHGLGRGAQPIAHRASGGAERLVTLMAEEALLLPRMDTDMALADVASRMTVPLGAACGCGVHDGPPGCVWKQAKRSMFGPHFRYKCASPRFRAELPLPAITRTTMNIIIHFINSLSEL